MKLKRGMFASKYNGNVGIKGQVIDCSTINERNEFGLKNLVVMLLYCKLDPGLIRFADSSAPSVR